MKYHELKRANVGDKVEFRPLEHDAGEPATGTITGFSPSKLTADLTQATAATINDLREALAKENKNKLQGNSPTDRRQTPNAGRRP
jgi:hypothetical protein